MAGVEILLHLPGEPAGHLPHDLAEQVVAAGLHQTFGQQADHRGQLDPHRQIKVPAHQGVGHECVHLLDGNLSGGLLIRGLIQPQGGIEVHVVEGGKGGIGSGRGHRLDAIDPRRLGQQFEADGGLHLEAEVAEAPKGEHIAIAIQRRDRHRGGTALKPALMPVEVSLHHRRGGTHLHQIGEAAAITAHPPIGAVAQRIGVGEALSRCGRGQKGQGQRTRRKGRGAAGLETDRGLARRIETAKRGH